MQTGDGEDDGFAVWLCRFGGKRREIGTHRTGREHVFACGPGEMREQQIAGVFRKRADFAGAAD